MVQLDSFTELLGGSRVKNVLAEVLLHCSSTAATQTQLILKVWKLRLWKLIFSINYILNFREKLQTCLSSRWMHTISTCHFFPTYHWLAGISWRCCAASWWQDVPTPSSHLQADQSKWADLLHPCDWLLQTWSLLLRESKPSLWLLLADLSVQTPEGKQKGNSLGNSFNKTITKPIW